MQRRVLIAHPSAELYGSDRVALESARALVDDGWAVHVTLTAEGPLAGLLTGAGCTVSVLPAPVLRKAVLSPAGLLRFAVETARLAPGMLRLLRRERPDLLYVSTLTVPLWLLLGRLLRRRVVCHVHEAEEAVPRPVRTGLAAPLLLAHRVVANSEASRSVLVADLPVLRRRIEVVYNGVPGPDRELRPPSAVDPSDREDRPVRLVLAGRVSPRKGTDVAVEALQLLRARGVDAELDLVGGVFPGYEWFEQEVRAQVGRHGLDDRVRWLGVLPDVWDALAAADVVLVPSRVEPFGNAAVEAMLAGRPVVAGDTQGLREIVRPGENGELAAPGDAPALADAIGRVLADRPAAVARAAAARAEAQDRYSPGRYRADVVALARRYAAAGR